MTAKAWTSPAIDLDATAPRSRPYSDAEALLQQGAPLRPDQFGQLDELFRQINGAELNALTQDPRYQAQLRRYEELSWQRSSMSISLVLLALPIMVGLVVAIGKQAP